MTSYISSSQCLRPPLPSHVQHPNSNPKLHSLTVAPKHQTSILSTHPHIHTYSHIFTHIHPKAFESHYTKEQYTRPRHFRIAPIGTRLSLFIKSRYSLQPTASREMKHAATKAVAKMAMLAHHVAISICAKP